VIWAASLSGTADARWARRAAPHVDCAVLGGLALDGPTRAAAREMVARDREEFLPADPLAWARTQVAALADAPVQPGLNVRASAPDAVAAAADVCAAHGALLEVNAHCRQAEMCAAGAGESLMRETDRLRAQVAAARAAPRVSVKLRAEVTDLGPVARAASAAGADVLHVDAMDTPESVRRASEAASDAAVVGNTGVRGRETARRYLARGADAVSAGRPTTNPDTLARVARAVRTARETAGGTTP
jgi:TIM-barrel protein